ncbi:MAG: hypothetical protein QM808_02375 [Steroidobacteraceae bacterium]
MNKAALALGVASGICLLLSSTQAQIKTIPKEGLPGLSKEAVEFEIEHNYRRENGLGGTVPPEPGTRPNSVNPQVLDGIWLVGRTYTVNGDGDYTLQSNSLPAAATGMSAGAAPGGAPGAAAGMGAGAAPAAAAPGGRGERIQCVPGSPFALGQPSRILQTDQVIYIFSNSGNSGVNNRRIVLNGKLPTNPTPKYAGYSVGHWEGDTLVVETTGLKPASGGGGGPGGAGISYTTTSVVTERIKKIEGGLKLENLISVEDPTTKKVSKQRLVSYYRPDLQYVEAPCEEYSDPFEGKYNAATGADAAPPSAGE